MIFAIILLIFVVTLYFYSTRTFDYWKKKGIKYDTPIPIFGNNAKGYFMQRSMSDLTADMYWKYPKEKVVGFFRASTPELIIRDPDLVKRVLITNFSHFYKRQLNPILGSDEPLLKNLFNADGDLWRLLRQRMTPAFTSGKLKAMFPLIVERAERLQLLLSTSHGKTVDAREVMARYTTDFIGACGFGLEANSLNKEDSEIRKLGVKIFEITFKDAFKAMAKQIFPQLCSNVRLSAKLEPDVMGMVNAILTQRNHQPSGRNDFIDQLLECQKKGTIVGDSIEKFNLDGTPETATLEMTDDIIAAQVFVFFAAGFETSSSTTSFTLHLLAYHPEVQKKVQDNIDAVLARHNNKLSYESIKEMSYLEMAFKESMRIFPSVGFLIRECAKTYTFEDINLTIDPGVKIMISLQAMQNDPQYFDKPEEFRPERFDPNELDSETTKYVYLPFGDGPRSCIGEFFLILRVRT